MSHPLGNKGQEKLQGHKAGRGFAAKAWLALWRREGRG